MPFHITENISTYLFTCITEHHDALDKDEMRENYEMLDNAVLTSRALYDVCEGFLETEIDSSTLLFKAVMNSIDIDWLSGSLSEWLQDVDLGEDMDEDGAESQTEYDPAPVPKKD